MAKKHGECAITGRKATTYTATMPDGTVLKKKSYFIHTDTAFIAAYKIQDKYIASGVTREVHDWGSQQFFPATIV